MKTMVILSDTHGNAAAVAKLSGIFSESDCIVHLGDGTADMREVFRTYPGKTFLVAGNCDFYGGGAPELVLEAEGHRILACHGHRYGVKTDLSRLAAAAREKDCDIALYGHTHIADTHEQDGVLLINPGCMRRYAPDISYCYLVLHGKKAVPTIVPVR